MGQGIGGQNDGVSVLSRYRHLYIKLVDTTSVNSEEAAPGIVLDFDEKNRVIGIEIKNASTFIDLSRLEILALPVVNLIVSEREPVKA